MGDLLKPKDLVRGRTDVPVRFEIEVEIHAKIYRYVVAFELSDVNKELRVLEEWLVEDGTTLYKRQLAELRLARAGQLDESFALNRDLVALPIVQGRSANDPIFIFKQWLANMLILRPVPSLILGDSEHATFQPNVQVTNFAAWFTGLLISTPGAYTKLFEYLRQVMPDLKDIKNQVVGQESRKLEVQFSNQQGSVTIPFSDLSDGEKCFMICAMVLASNTPYGHVFCFWDEPDNYLAMSEVGHFVLALRSAFQSGGQFIATSHNSEAIRQFSDENTFLLYRNSHLEPTIIRPITEIRASGELNGDLVSALIRGDVGP